MVRLLWRVSEESYSLKQITYNTAPFSVTYNMLNYGQIQERGEGYPVPTHRRQQWVTKQRAVKHNEDRSQDPILVMIDTQLFLLPAVVSEQNIIYYAGCLKCVVQYSVCSYQTAYCQNFFSCQNWKSTPIEQLPVSFSPQPLETTSLPSAVLNLDILDTSHTVESHHMSLWEVHFTKCVTIFYPFCHVSKIPFLSRLNNIPSHKGAPLGLCIPSSRDMWVVSAS